MTHPAAADAPTPDYIRNRILEAPALARFHPWGVRDYAEVLAVQERLRDARRADSIPDTWLAGEHPAVITQGVRGQSADLVDPVGGLPVYRIDRGGMTTLHNPGQLVIYPIVKTQGNLLAQARVSAALLATVRDWLAAVSGVELEIPRGRPGLFLGARKVAAIGISVHGHVSMHGIAVNLCNDLSPWRAIIPCGEPSTRPMTLSEASGRRYTPAELIEGLPAWLAGAWGYDTVQTVATLDA